MQTPEGLMEILEIRNPNDVSSMFEAISLEQRVMPSIIMIFASSKGILLLIVNVILMSIVVSTTWIDQREKAKTQNFTKNQNNLLATVNSAFTPD